MEVKLRKYMLQVIGWYEVICGGGALLWFGYAAVMTGGLGGWGLVFLGLYALMTVAGFRLAQQRSGGTVLSVLVQAMQVVRISTVRFEYLFLAGGAVWGEVGSNRFGFCPQINAAFRLKLISGFGPQFVDQPWLVGVNLIPLAIVLYLAIIGRKMADKPEAVLLAS
jgi:hypothetical protein